MKRTMIAALVVASLVTTVAEAQGGGVRRPLGGRRGAGQQQPDSMRQRRAQLEGEVRERIARQMQTRLGATDAQMTKVREINQRFAQRRQLLLQQEREIRMAIREEGITADSSRSAEVADLLDRFVRTQRQRIDLLEQEQKDLSGVLTPHQRALYIGFEENMRMRLQQAQQGGRMGPPPDGQQGGQPQGGLRPDGRPLRRPPPGGAIVPP